MYQQSECPTCGHTKFDTLHHLRIIDQYQEPEKILHKTGDYRRNYVLFEHILQRQVAELTVEFRLCRHCGLIFFSPRPDKADLAIKYQLVITEGDTEMREQHGRLVDLSAMRAQRIRCRLEPHWKKQTGRALDIGGANGHCLGELTTEFDCGILDFEDRNLWPGVKKWGKTLDDLHPDEQFDIIMCCHTLEHIPDICSFLGQVKEHLAPEGLLYLEVPYGCADEIYETFNILTHLNFFSEGSLGFLLEHVGLHTVRMLSQPVLSTKRYLPVIAAIARKDDSRPVDRNYRENGFAVTQHQMSRSLNKAVTVANLQLVLSRPIQYGIAFVMKALRPKKADRIVTHDANGN
jgi:hypothetical protein